MNLTGTYSFYENGVKIGEHKNLLTNYGKRFLTSYLAGNVDFTSKDLSLGIGKTAASVFDKHLEFEFYLNSIDSGSIDIQTDVNTGLSTYAVVYKSTVPADVEGIISEVGIFPASTEGTSEYSGRYITTFENSFIWEDSLGNQPTKVSTPKPRIGGTNFVINAAVGSTTEYFLSTEMDVSEYTVNDSISLAYTENDRNLDYAFVRFYSSDNDYYQVKFLPYPTNGEKIRKVLLSEMYSPTGTFGSPDATSIIKISVGAKAKSSGATSVFFDGLRFNDEDSYSQTYGLISRSVLTTPIQKYLGRKIDIEYRIGIGF
jgi:hypothetical protein